MIPFPRRRGVGFTGRWYSGSQFHSPEPAGNVRYVVAVGFVACRCVVQAHRLCACPSSVRTSPCRTTARRCASLQWVPRAQNLPGPCPYREEHEMKLLKRHMLGCLRGLSRLFFGFLLLPVVAAADASSQVASRRWRAASARFTQLTRQSFQAAAAAFHRSLPVGVRRQSRLWCGRHGLLCRLTPACSVI